MKINKFFSFVSLAIIALLGSLLYTLPTYASPADCSYRYVVLDGGNFPGSGYSDGDDALAIEVTATPEACSGVSLSVGDYVPHQEGSTYTFRIGQNIIEFNNISEVENPFYRTALSTNQGDADTITVDDPQVARDFFQQNPTPTNPDPATPVPVDPSLVDVRSEEEQCTEQGGTFENGECVPGSSRSSCEANAGNFSWGICPMLRGLGGFLVAVDEFLIRTLSVPPEYYRNEGLRNAWESFRNISYSLIVPVALVMVVSTALGFELFSAYTIKRVLPRFVIAILFIALSYEIVTLIIQIVNEVSVGILGLINNAFGQGGDRVTLATLFDTGGEGGFLIAALAALAAPGAVFLYQGGAWVLLGAVAVFAIVILTVLLLLMFRQILLVALILMAPLAVLAWIFPNNTKLWNLWKDTFWKLLLLFPIVMLLIGAGRGFAFVIASIGDADAPPNLFETILKLVAYIGPYFLIPTMFKFAGSTFANIAGMTNSREKGVLDRIRKRSGRTREIYKGAAQSTWQQKAQKKMLNRAGGNAKYAPGLTQRLSTGDVPGYRRNISKDIISDNLAKLTEEETKRAIYNINVSGINIPDATFEVDGNTRKANGKAYTKDDALKAMVLGSSVKNVQTGETVGDGREETGRAASMILAQQGNAGALRELVSSTSAVDGEAGRQMQMSVSDALQSNVGGLIGKAPDLYKGRGALEDFKAEEFVAWDASTVQAAFEHISGLSGDKQTQALRSMNAALEQARVNPDVRESVTSKFVTTINEQVNRTEYASLRAELPQANHFSADGVIIDIGTRPSGPATVPPPPGPVPPLPPPPRNP